MIIHGYAGIGKTYLAHHYPNVIDLESTPFEKDWDRYAKCIIHYHKQGFLVLVSCHKEIRQKILDSKEIYYDDRLTIVPNINDKELYKKRYLDRGNNLDFIDLQTNNWENWLDEHKNRILTENWEIMLPGETLYDTIIRLSKESPYRFCNYDQCPVSDCKDMKGRCNNPLKIYTELWK